MRAHSRARQQANHNHFAETEIRHRRPCAAPSEVAAVREAMRATRVAVAAIKPGALTRAHNVLIAPNRAAIERRKRSAQLGIALQCVSQRTFQPRRRH